MPQGTQGTQPPPQASAALHAEDVLSALQRAADPARVAAAQRFFKTGPGEYGEGDRFLGVTVPKQRVVAKACAALPLAEALRLLESPLHEARLTALFILVRQFQRGDEATQRLIIEGWLARTARLNNWDLVDSSAPYLLGPWLLQRDRSLLHRLARSPLLWERRVAVLATFAFIRAGEHADALAVCEVLVDDEHDLIQKAVGWMLRELGGRVGKQHLEGFLRRHAASMPRTALRYAIEKLPKAERTRWLSERAARTTAAAAPTVGRPATGTRPRPAGRGARGGPSRRA